METIATELGKAYVQIIPSAQGIKAKMQEILGDEMPSGEEHGKNYAQGLVSTIKKAIAAAGIGLALKSALTEGAALEQSLGGIETLFKGSADTVIENAKRAYQTAGVSANAYMENVTSFSASLISSLGGDTAKAAEVANTAMVDMSDNANKMGTDMRDIQNAYQGFAKQNYTMLDNLKLGYGGTKTEMQRLLEDAQKLTGVKYDINNLSDVYNAIHAIQENLGIAGTTSQEAATTLSGSFNSMKAAAQDFAGYLTLGMDITPAAQNLVSTASTFLFGNLFPALGNIFTALPGAISTFVSTAGATIAQNFSIEMLNGAVASASEFINGLGSGLQQNIPTFLAQALPMVLQFSENIRANAGQLIDAGLNLIMQLAQGIADSLPTLITYIPQIVTNIAGIINDNAPKLLATAGQVILTLAKGLIAAIPTLVANIPQIIQAIVAVFSAFNWLNLGKQAVTAIKNGIISMVGAVRSAGTNVMRAIVNALMSLPSKLLSLGRSGVSGLANGIRAAAGLVRSGITTVINALIAVVRSAPSKMLALGKNIVQGIANGIRNAASAVVKALGDVVSNAIDAIKKKLGIASPSKVFRDAVGQWIPEGIAVGITSNADSVQESINSLVDLKNLGISNAVPKSPIVPTSGTSNVTKVEYNQTINSPKAMTRREVRRETKNAVRGLRPYYA